MNGSERMPREDAESAVGRGCAFFVIDDETKRLPIRQRAGAALDRLLVCRAALERIKPAAEAYFRVGSSRIWSRRRYLPLSRGGRRSND